MKTYLVVLFFAWVCAASSVLQAQIIHLSLPEHANTEYTLYFNKGQKTQAVFSGKIDATGKSRITIPAAYSSYKGIAKLALQPKGELSFIVNKENFTVNSSRGRLNYLYSKENQYMANLFEGKINEVKGAVYAPAYEELFRYTQRLQGLSKGQSITEIPALRTYLTYKLDMESLYTSGFWNLTISGTFGLYPDKKLFGQDMVAAMKRTASQEVFSALAEDLVTICEQFGWTSAEDTIISYLAQSGRLKNPSKTIKTLFAAQQLKPGTLAPALEGYPQALSNKLIVFYESGCDNCEAELARLMEQYAVLQQKGIEVITVSADNDKAVHDYHSKKFPWKYKLCDLKAFEGVNFKRYGVVGTPTLYLIDKNKKIVGRYALLKETGLLP